MPVPIQRYYQTPVDKTLLQDSSIEKLIACSLSVNRVDRNDSMNKLNLWAFNHGKVESATETSRQQGMPCIVPAGINDTTISLSQYTPEIIAQTKDSSMKRRINNVADPSHQRCSLRFARQFHGTEKVQCREVGKIDIEHKTFSSLRLPATQKVHKKRKTLLKSKSIIPSTQVIALVRIMKYQTTL